MALLFLGAPPAARAKLAGLSNGVLNLGLVSVSAFGLLANQVGLVAVFVASGILVASAVFLISPMRDWQD
jgi:hypothetical protein